MTAIVTRVITIMASCCGLEKLPIKNPPIPSPIMPIPPRGEGLQEAAAFVRRPKTMTGIREALFCCRASSKANTIAAGIRTAAQTRPQGMAKIVGVLTNRTIVPERPKNPLAIRERSWLAALKPPPASTAPANTNPPIVAVMGLRLVVVSINGGLTGTRKRRARPRNVSAPIKSTDCIVRMFCGIHWRIEAIISKKNPISESMPNVGCPILNLSVQEPFLRGG